MASGHIGNVMPRKGLRVRLPCPPLSLEAASVIAFAASFLRRFDSCSRKPGICLTRSLIHSSSLNNQTASPPGNGGPPSGEFWENFAVEMS